MNFLKSIFSFNDSSRDTKPSLKLSPKVLAVKERIDARRKKEEKAAREQSRLDFQLNGHQTNAYSLDKNSITVHEEIIRLEKKASYTHSDRLTADSEIFANSRFNQRDNKIEHEAQRGFVAPELRLPDSAYVVAELA
jgi:hypothetical protein